MTTETLQSTGLTDQVTRSIEIEKQKSITSLGCKPAAWSPEVHDFYGDAASILAKMDDVRIDLEDRRVFYLFVERANEAEVRFFERMDDGLYAVSSWRGESLGDLPSQVADMLLANRGVNCVGEQVKAILAKAISLQLEATVPAPASARAAFAHTVRAHGENDFIRATTALLC